MTVLVTGGAGFIGAHLVASLVDEGAEVVVLDNLRRGAKEKLPTDVRFIDGDVRDRETVRAACAGATRVYHLAAQSNVLGAVSDMDYSFTTNVVGTYNVLVAAREAGVGRVVFASSREAYGEVETIPVREDRAMNPKNAYGASKAAGEVYCRAVQGTYGLDVSVLRLANVYGPGDHDRVIPIWLDRARRGLTLDLYGGAQVLDLVPVELVVEALRKAGETPLDGLPVNIGSGRSTTLHDLAARIQTLPGVSVDVRVLPPRAVEVTRYVADVAAMKGVLGLTPPFDPLEGLDALWAAEQAKNA